MEEVKKFIFSKTFFLTLISVFLYFMFDSNFLSLKPIKNDDFNVLQIITSPFTHFSKTHLYGNLLFLITVGYVFERSVSTMEYIYAFLISSVLVILIHCNYENVNVGGISGFTSMANVFCLFYLDNKIKNIVLKTFLLYSIVSPLNNILILDSIAHTAHIVCYFIGYIFYKRKVTEENNSKMLFEN